jgi:hypothetical protein
MDYHEPEDAVLILEFILVTGKLEVNMNCQHLSKNNTCAAATRQYLILQFSVSSSSLVKIFKCIFDTLELYSAWYHFT